MTIANDICATGDCDLWGTEFPVRVLRRGGTTLTLALPDAERGYYRGTRFDWAGAMREVRSAHHLYCGEWFERHNPLAHDGVCGTVDEFAQQGYDEAPVGGEFMKIGVGMLRKSSDEPYDRFQLYEIVDAGVRTTEFSADSATFRHTVQGAKFAYDYRKRVSVRADGFTLEYSLTNLGTAVYNGSVYNHNFFTLDNLPIGTDSVIRFASEPTGEWRQKYEQVRFEGREIRYDRDLQSGETAFCGSMHWHSPSCEGYSFELANRRSGAGVRVQGSRELLSAVMWSCRRTACVEPYIALHIATDATARWRTDYKFFEL